MLKCFNPIMPDPTMNCFGDIVESLPNSAFQYYSTLRPRLAQRSLRPLSSTQSLSQKHEIIDVRIFSLKIVTYVAGIKLFFIKRCRPKCRADGNIRILL